jgi:xanthine dehydrogenase accessory factor
MSAWIAELAALVAATVPAVLVTVAAVKGSAPREAGAATIVTERGLQGTIGGGRLEYRAARLARTMLRGGAGARLKDFPLGPELGQCCGGQVALHFHPSSAADRAWLDPLRAWIAGGKRAVLVFDPRDADGRRFVACADDSAGDAGAQTAAAQRLARRVLSGGVAESEGLVAMPVTPPDCVVYLFGAGHVGRALAAILGQLPCRVVWIDERNDGFPAGAAANVSMIRAADPDGQ